MRMHKKKGQVDVSLLVERICLCVEDLSTFLQKLLPLFSHEGIKNVWLLARD